MSDERCPELMVTILTEAHVQDVADVLEGPLTHSDLDDVGRRFGLEQLMSVHAKGPGSPSKKDRIQAVLREIPDIPEALQALNHMVGELPTTQGNEDRLKKALQGAPLVVDFDDDRRMTLLHQVGEEARHPAQGQPSYIEKKASKKVKEHLRKAQEKLGAGQPDDCLQECRRALEGMVHTSYSDALDELVSEGLIQQKSGKAKIRGREALYTPYGYCSSIGGHTKAGKQNAGHDQAEYGLMLTETTIYRLLRLGAEAKRQGTKLQRWDF